MEQSGLICEELKKLGVDPWLFPSLINSSRSYTFCWIAAIDAIFEAQPLDSVDGSKASEATG
jgi:hypothetical protein